jgi:hypothetical protein
MSMNWKGALAAGAVLGAGVLAACSDSATAPSARPALVPKTSFAVGQTTTTTAVAGLLKICKYGDASGTFTITDVGDGQAADGKPGGTGNPSILDDNGGVGGNQANMTPGSEATPNCRIVVEDFGDGNLNKGDFFTVVETDAPGVTETVISCTINGGAVLACPTNFFINNVHGWTILVRNIADTPDVCTYTKGWYQNKNGAPTIVLTIDGRTPDQQRAIFEASPGQPGNVTWGTNNKPNNLLNLYQQLLAAINNLDGNLTAGPTAVDNAISAALAGTGGSNLHISTTLTNEQISALIDTLSSFNEGEFAGFPHCSDEILVVN